MRAVIGLCAVAALCLASPAQAGWAQAYVGFDECSLVRACLETGCEVGFMTGSPQSLTPGVTCAVPGYFGNIDGHTFVAVRDNTEHVGAFACQDIDVNRICGDPLIPQELAVTFCDDADLVDYFHGGLLEPTMPLWVYVGGPVTTRNACGAAGTGAAGVVTFD